MRHAPFVPLTVAGLFAFVAAASTQDPRADERRRGPDHQDRGLPVPGATHAPFDRDPDHPANRVFRALWLAELVPSEVAAVLPRERGDEAGFFAEGWYFGKRDGTDADRRWFGGDGRQLPVEGFAPEAARALASDLAALDGEALAGLRASPRRAIHLQNDLLRLLRRLLDTEQNPELLAPLRAAVGRLALPAPALQEPDLATFAVEQLAEAVAPIAPETLVAIERRSTRLFDAAHSLSWSDVFVAVPGGRDATLALLTTLAAADKDTLPTLPIGTTALLVQGLVAIDAEGRPRATEVVVDVRIKVLRNREPLHRDNATSTHDGVDFVVWQLERAALGEERLGLVHFRRVAEDDQELFRDYGTRKHTTYRGQCSLCHRRSFAPDEPLAGFSSLRPSSRPRPMLDAGQRRRLAETQVEGLLRTIDEAIERAGR
jgi:hypothetical protein